MPWIGSIPEYDVPPKIIGRSIEEVRAVEFYLIVCIFEKSEVSSHDAIISEERRDHIDKVAPMTQKYIIVLLGD